MELLLLCRRALDRAVPDRSGALVRHRSCDVYSRSALPPRPAARVHWAAAFASGLLDHARRRRAHWRDRGARSCALLGRPRYLPGHDRGRNDGRRSRVPGLMTIALEWLEARSMGVACGVTAHAVLAGREVIVLSLIGLLVFFTIWTFASLAGLTPRHFCRRRG